MLRVNTSGTAFFGNTVNPGITSIKDINEINNKLVIFPNPARNIININFQSDKTTNKYITVLDITGRVAFKQMLPVQKGNNSVRLNLPKLAKGCLLP
ncbi:MAG: T9SS type A sorting domain-containing protein [Segetibacter sp.]